jgi:2-C-methyl-D-erythritol 2,4-cyclodiphosphate synthase
MRVGIGYDIHRLVKGRPMILGGVKIHSDKGLLGHSDGDALTHALIDAVLGALGVGDIGQFFSDKDQKHKNADSLGFIPKVRGLLKKHGYRIVNLDAVVIAEKPKLAPFKPAIKRSLGRAFGIKPTQIGLKGKTNERLGSIGQGKSLACLAIASLSKANAK